jgi:AcrR family transcriptional regulator
VQERKKRGRKNIAEERRPQILDALYRSAVDKGLERASLRVVAKEAGCPVSVLLHYFDSRDDMISALVKRRTNEILDTLRAEIEDAKNPESRFEDIIDFCFSPKTQRLEGKSLFYDCCSNAHRSESIRETFKQQIRQQRRDFVELLSTTSRFSRLSAAEKKHIANVVIALVEGTFYVLDMDGDNVSLPKMSKLLKRFIDLYAEDGLRSKRGR